MKIPEAPKQICKNFAKQGRYDELLDYLIGCNFTIIRFVGNNDFLVNNCCKNQIYLGSATGFNDKFDCCWKFPQEIIDFFKEQANWDIEDDSMRNVCQKKSDKEKENIFIACFSDKENLTNSKMWYLYASKYQGVCLEYNISKLAYVIKATMILYDIHLDFSPVEYSSKNGEIHLENFNENSYNTIFTKSKAWADEKEWRLHWRNPEKKPLTIYCQPDAIYLGAEISKTKKKKITRKLNKKIKLFETKFDYIKLKIVTKEI